MSSYAATRPSRIRTRSPRVLFQVALDVFDALVGGMKPQLLHKVVSVFHCTSIKVLGQVDVFGFFEHLFGVETEAEEKGR